MISIVNNKLCKIKRTSSNLIITYAGIKLDFKKLGYDNAVASSIYDVAKLNEVTQKNIVANFETHLRIYKDIIYLSTKIMYEFLDWAKKFEKDNYTNSIRIIHSGFEIFNNDKIYCIEVNFDNLKYTEYCDFIKKLIEKNMTS